MTCVASAAASPLMRKIENGKSGLLLRRLVDGEGGQQDGGADQRADRARHAPALVRGLDDRVDEQQHPGGHQHCAEHVEVGRARAVVGRRRE